MDRFVHLPAKTSAPCPEDSEGVGFIDHQLGVVTCTDRTDCGQIRAAALHAEQAFRDDQRRVGLGTQTGQASLQIGWVIVGEAFQPGSARPHTDQQGMVDQPIGNNRAMAIDQCRHSSDVGLESTREKQHSVPPQPTCQLFFKFNVYGPGSRHQPRAAGTQAI